MHIPPISFQLFKMTSFVLATLMTVSASAGTNENGNKTNGDEIVVVGNKTIKEAVGDFIDTTIAPPKGGRNIGQYARFSAPICPKVFGFSDSNNVAIEKRIRGVSLAADIRVDESGCQPNVYVVVIENGESAITMLRQKHHRIFGALPIYKRDQLEKSKGPVFGWKAIVPVSTDGGSGTGNSGNFGLQDIAFFNRTHVKSLIKQPVKQAMKASYLLLEKKALAGLTTVQIADYATMHSLIEANGDPDQEAAFFSILSLLSNKKNDLPLPDAISEWDLILLSTLYSTPSDVRAGLQRSAMQQKFVKEVEAAQAQ